MTRNAYDAILAGDDPQDPARTVYDQVAQDPAQAAADAQAQRVKQAATVAAPTTPDTAAETQRLADEYKVPAAIVGRNLELFRQKSQIDAPDVDQIVKQSPALATVLEDPAQHAIVKDDLAPLGALEWLLTAWPKAIAQGVNAQRYGALRTKSLFSGTPLTPEETDLMGSYKYNATLGGELGAGDAWWRGAVTGLAKFGTFVGEASGWGLAGGAVGAVAGGLAGTVVEPGAGTVAGAVVGAKTGFGLGEAFGLARVAFEGAAGPAFDQISAFHDETGHPIDPAVAKYAALGVGVVNAALMGLSGELLLKRIPGMTRLTDAFTKDAVEAALRKPTVRLALSQLATRWAGPMAAGTALMAGQEAATIIGEEIAKTADAHLGTPQPSADEIRPDGTTKGSGYFGALARPDGAVSSELSIADSEDPRLKVGGKYLDYPALVPTLTADEITTLLNLPPDGEIPQAIKDKAEAHALARLDKGEPVFAQPGEANTSLYPELARAAAVDRPGIPHITEQEIRDRMIAAIESGAQSFALASLIGPAIAFPFDVARARAADANGRFFDALADGVKDSKTMQRAPEAAQAFLARATKDGPVETVYAPIGTFTTYWQSKGVDPAKVATRLTGDDQAFARATAAGTDLPIATARYATTLAGTEHNAFFADELRLGDPRAMNRREAKALFEKLKEPLPPPAAGADPLREGIVDQLAGAGFDARSTHPIADVAAGVFSNIADRANLPGVDAASLAARYLSSVSREGVPVADAARPPGEAVDIPASVGTRNETAAQRRARVTAHTAALVSSVTRDALAVDPTVDPARIKHEIEWRLAAFEDGLQGLVESGQDPGEFLRAVAAAGGLKLDTAGGREFVGRGEIAQYAESRDIRGVRGASGRVIHNRGAATWKGVAGVFHAEGLYPDTLLERLRQDPRYAHMTTLNHLWDALDEALNANTAAADTSRLPGTEDLSTLGVRLGTRWWDQGASRDAVEEAGGDTSFDFAQGPLPGETPAETWARRMLEYDMVRRDLKRGTAADFPPAHNQAAQRLEVFRRLASIQDRLARRRTDTLYQEPRAPLRDAAGRTIADTPDTRAAFLAWFKASATVDADGRPLPVYNGAMRGDRVGTEFLKERATSGPLAFFTDSRLIAEKYSTGKHDTSFEQPEDYRGWFKFTPAGGGAELDLRDAWRRLTPAERATVLERLPTVGYEHPDTGEGRIIAGSSSIAGKDHVEWVIRDARGNGLEAAKELWLNSGALFDDEAQFLDVLAGLGLEGRFRFDDPHAKQPKVTEVYLSIQRPLVTNAIPPEVLAALEARAAEAPGPSVTLHGAADLWDKNLRDPGEWIAELLKDRETGKNSYVWSSIPDWVTDTLKALGYDGIHDSGGKMGGDPHSVWIPFEPEQIKSVENRGTWDPRSPNILFQDAVPDRMRALEDLATDEAMGVAFPENEASHFPNGEDAVNCTACARRILELNGGEGEIYGWEDPTNPTAIVGSRHHEAGGHDFAVLDGRFLVDAWAKNVEMTSARAVFDLDDPADRLEVLRLYGNPATWVRAATPLATGGGLGWAPGAPRQFRDLTTLYQSGRDEVWRNPMFYSRLTTAVEAAKMEKGTGAQWQGVIRNSKAGVNLDEFAFAHVDDLEAGRQYTKQEVLDYLSVNTAQIDYHGFGGGENDGDESAGPDEDDIRERAYELHDSAVDDELENLDLDYILGTATAHEEEDERQVEQLDRHGDPVLDEDGDPVMVYENFSVWYPAIEGGYTPRYERGGRRPYGVKERDGVELVEDGDVYETEEEATRAAQKHLDDLDREPYDELMREKAEEGVDSFDTYLETAEEELRSEGNYADAADEDGTHFSSYTVKGPVEDGSYREVFVTAPNVRVTRPEYQVLTVAENRQFDRAFPHLREQLVQMEPYQRRNQLDAILAMDPASRPDLAPDEFAATQRAVQQLRREDDFQLRTAGWRDGHSGYGAVKNPLVRLRFDIRQLADGRRFLFVHEIQPPALDEFPSMPELFQKHWMEVGLKYALAHAVERGLDGVALATGEQNRNFYNALDQHVNEIHWSPILALATGDSLVPKEPLVAKIEDLSHDFDGSWRVYGSDGEPRYFSTLEDAQAYARAINASTGHIVGIEQPAAAARPNPYAEGGAVQHVVIDLKRGTDLRLNVRPDGTVASVAGESSTHQLVGHTLAEILGGELGAQIQGAHTGRIAGAGLNIGGLKLRLLYDKVLPETWAKLPVLKQTKTRVTRVDVKTGEREVLVGAANPTVDAVRARIEAKRRTWTEAMTYYARKVLDNMALDGRDYAMAVAIAGTPPAMIDELGFGGYFERQHEITAQRAVEFTPALREKILGGQALYQPAYHGSPADFDRFSTRHIGTGQGAATYGWGLYFAGAEGVATFHRDQLVDGKDSTVEGGGRLPNWVARRIKNWEQYKTYTRESTIDELLTDFKARIGEAEERVASKAPQYWNDAGNLPGLREVVLGLERAKAGARIETPGHIYTVDIPDTHIAKMLDYDKLITDQPIAIQEAVATAYQSLYGYRPIWTEWAADTTGGAAYRALDGGHIAAGLSSERASKALAAAGIPGMKYLDQGSRAAGDGTRNLVVFDDSIVTITHKDGTPVTPAERERFLQDQRPPADPPDQAPPAPAPAAGAPRGATTFTRDASGRVVRSQIDLFRAADPSTMLHELAHPFLEMLGELSDQIGALDPAALTDGQRGILADYGSLLTWFGVTNRFEIRTEQHEQFARGFEAYLRDGKAPSVELRSAFAQFRAWLVTIYRTALELRVDVTPEVAAVMDRLVATDAAIAAAAGEAPITPLFTTAEGAGMLPLDFASYQDQVRAASTRAQEELQARLLRALQREQSTTWKQEREQERAAALDTLGAQPVYRALSAMRTGAWPDGTPVHEGQAALPIKLSRDSLVAQFGRAILAQLPKPYVYAADSGISADTAAELFGFSSGDELVQALIASKPIGKMADAQADAAMFAKYGDPMRDGRLEALARDAVEGEHRQAIVRVELEALTKGMLKATIPSADVLRDAADSAMAVTRIRDLRPGLYLMAAQRASKRAFDLLATNRDRAGAVRAKLEELQNLAHYRAARDAKEHVESWRTTLQGYTSTAAQKRFGKAGADHLDQINAFLDRYELAKVPQASLDRRTSLRAFAERMVDAHLPIDIPDALLDDARRINYQDATLDEFRGVYETVEQIAHLARLKHTLLAAAKHATFEEARDRLTASIELHNERVAPPLEFRSGLDELHRKVADGYASLAKIAMLARALDGHEDGGEMWEQIIRPINAAADAEQARSTVEAPKLAALLDTAYPGRELWTLNEKRFIPELHASLSKEARLAVALNWGSQTSRDRILADPTRQWSPAQVQAILDTLDHRDLTFVQGVFDFVNGFWPEIEAKQKRVTGLAPEKVLPVEIVAKAGTIRGGYYPLVYDGRLVARADILQKTGEAKLLAGAAYVSASTRRGHVEARKQHVKLSVRLELGVLYGHLDQVIHDLTHHEVLVDVNRLLGDGDVQAGIYATKGDRVYQQFTAALEDIALNRSGQPAKHLWDEAATFMRTGTQLSSLAFNVWTMVQQPFGILNGMERVGPTWVLRGMRRWLTDAAHMENTAAWIRSVSPLMSSRGDTATQDLRDLRAHYSVRGGWFDQLVRTATRDTATQRDIVDAMLWHIGLAQQVADIPTWLGAYLKAMDADATDEPRAYALADQAVLDSQGGGQIKDLAQVQRGGPWARLFLSFYSYGSTVINATADAYGRTKPSWRRPASVGSFLVSLALLQALPALGTVALSRALGKTGGRPGDDNWFVEFAKQSASGALNGIPIARELTGLFNEGVRGYAGPAGARAVGAAYDFGVQLKQGVADKALARTGLQVAGILWRFPATQTQKSIDGFLALRDGRTHNPLALLVGAPPKP